MSNLNKLNFTALEVSRRNYLKWVQDMKLHLTVKSLRATIEELINDEPVNEAQKATAMIFIRRHIHDALQTEYLAEEDPRTIWLALADRFNHQKDIYLPEERHDCQHLCFQDFKSMNEYNSEFLMKNHQARSTGSNTPPEKYATNSSNHNRQKPRYGLVMGSKAHHEPKVHRTEAYPREET
ncbi:uncharacterized protein [Malus domestica]|uniref:uncharacterized protein n=1 Tax=Malus domestica TaxID=3750 RepID=UPI003974A4AB